MLRGEKKTSVPHRATPFCSSLGQGGSTCPTLEILSVGLSPHPGTALGIQRLASLEKLQGKLTHVQAAAALESTASVGNCGQVWTQSQGQSCLYPSCPLSQTVTRVTGSDHNPSSAVQWLCSWNLIAPAI